MHVSKSVAKAARARNATPAVPQSIDANQIRERVESNLLQQHDNPAVPQLIYLRRAIEVAGTKLAEAMQKAKADERVTAAVKGFADDLATHINWLALTVDSQRRGLWSAAHRSDREQLVEDVGYLMGHCMLTDDEKVLLVEQVGTMIDELRRRVPPPSSPEAQKARKRAAAKVRGDARLVAMHMRLPRPARKVRR
jgi:hypothetical protein